jgi:DNA primase
VNDRVDLRAVARQLRHDAADPLALCKRLGIDRPHVKQAGGALVCCPSHREKVPSCSVTRGPDGTVRCKCHACSWSGDAIDLVAAVRGLDTRKDFRTVLLELASVAGRWDVVAELDGHSRHTPHPATRPAAIPPPFVAAVSDARFDAIARWIIERCPLRRQPDVRAFVEARSIFADAEGCDCGALPPPASQHLLTADLTAQFGDSDLEHAGVLRRGTFVFAAHRLLIPWFDRHGRIMALQRRRLDGGDPRYVWSRGRSPKAPFGADLFDDALDYLGGDGEVIVCEGALDTFARRKIARQRGERAVVLGLPKRQRLR